MEDDHNCGLNLYSESLTSRSVAEPVGVVNRGVQTGVSCSGVEILFF